jgi:AcrR family transcriptional regulator
MRIYEGRIRESQHLPKAPEKKPARTRNPVETRAKLIRAAVGLLAEKGYEALSLKEATTRARLSRGVAYQHFKDRDHLLREAKSWISRQMADAVRQLRGVPLEERIAHDVQLILDNREAAILLVGDAIAGRDLGTHHPLYKLVSRTLAGFQARGEARAGIDREVLTYIMLAVNAAVLMFCQAHRGENSATLAARFASEWSHMLRDGIYSSSGNRRLLPEGRLSSRARRARALPNASRS